MVSLYTWTGRLWWRLPASLRATLHTSPLTARTKRLFSRLSSYWDAMMKYGAGRGWRLWWQISHLQAPASFPVPGSKHQVWIRPDTADPDVFRSVFLRDECRVPIPAGRQPRVIVDAGAYVGYTAVYYAMRYPAARIVAIEPQSANFEQLRKNTKGLDRITLVEGAVWHQHDPLEIVNPAAASHSFRMTAASDGPAGVRSHTMSDIMKLADTVHIDILKLDVEGAEYDILRHSEEWIGCVNLICAEMHDRYRPGCTAAFRAAVKDTPLRMLVDHGEKLIARRDPWID